jgi:hypothetical protein
VVAPPEGSDVYMIARLWNFWPILELEKGKTYKLHLTSMDYNHGFRCSRPTSTSSGAGLRARDQGHAQRVGHFLHRVQRVLRHWPPRDGGSHVREVSEDSHDPTTYRTCPRACNSKAGRGAHENQRRHGRGGLLVGGLLAIGVVLTRWPAVHWLPADTFYMVLTAHGIDMLIFWIIFFEVAVLYFCLIDAAALSHCHAKIAWLGFALMLIGVVNNVVVFQGSSSVMMTSYVPMMAHWSFYLA